MGRLIAVAVLGLVLVGMGRMITTISPSAAEASTAPVRGLQKETLSAAGLGDLRIGLTTLGDVLDAYGSGNPSLLLSDDVAVELQFAEGAFCLMFSAPTGGSVHRRIMREGPRNASIALHTGVKAVREVYPDLAALPLTSLSVRRPWFEGATTEGIRLGDSFREAARRHPGSGRPARDPFLAGTATPEPLGTAHHAAGMSFFAGRGPVSGMDTAGAALERLGAGEQVVEMIVVFRPGF
jgi:hypothetical protein